MTISRGGLRYTYRLRQYAAKDGKRQLQLFITVAGREIELGTPIRLFPNDWDKKNKRVRDTEPFAAEYRDWMHEAEKRLGVVAKYYFGREAELTREVLAQAISGKQAVEGGTLAEAMEAHRMIKARAISAGSMKMYNVTLRNVQKHRIGTLQVQDIQRADVEEYVRALQTSGMENITIKNYIAMIKTALKERKERGLLQYSESAFDVKIKQKELYTVALTLEEVEMLRSIGTATEGERGAKEIFLVGCFTGMRASDILTLRVSDVRIGEGQIVRNQKKTGGAVVIPILPIVEDILKERIRGKEANDKVFKLSDRYLITMLKVLAKRAGMDRPVLTGKLTGTQVKEMYRPLHEVIATHTARRTFVTIAQSLGFDPLFIMKITGHKNLQAFQRYYRLTMTDRVLAEYKDRWGAIAGTGPRIENQPGAGGEVARCEIRTVLRLRASGMPDAVVLREVGGRRQYYGLWVGQQATGMEGADYAAIEMGEVVPTDAEAAVREAMRMGQALPFCLAEEVVLKKAM